MRILLPLFFIFILSKAGISQVDFKLDSILFSNSNSLYKISETESYLFKKPSTWEHFSHFPGDIAAYTTDNFRIDNVGNIVGMTMLTLFLVGIDQELVDGAKKIGKKLGIKGERNIKNVAWIGTFPIQMPTDFSSGLYFIGDGWTHATIMTGFFTYGYFGDDNRALRTASQIAQGLLTVTFTTQLLKHLTGRESPYKATKPRGKWDFFPNQFEYHKNVPSFDAFPSGHLASAMMVFTIVTENYPEYTFIKPLGYTLLSILSFQMLNNGVHWASDYPLALAIGYGFGKLATNTGRKTLSNKNTANRFSIEVGVVGNNALGATLN